MVVLNRIYTRTGDDGTTGLGGGERRPKYDGRVEAYGTVDETNSVIGVAILAIPPQDAEVAAFLVDIQNDLFDLGADLCTLDTAKNAATKKLRMIDPQVERLEAAIDRLNAELTPLRSFVLPGGSLAAAHLHQARTVCRRAERLMVELAHDEPGQVGGAALRYINRLSDFLFVAARYVNGRGAQDVLWAPGKTALSLAENERKTAV